MTRLSTFAAALALCLPGAAFAANGLGPQGYAGGGGSSTIECDSSGGEQHRCATPGWNGARMVKQLSHSPCIEGETWGFDQGSQAVWVDKGCRGQFALLGYEGRHSRSDTSGGGEVVECDSSNGEMRKCAIPSYWQGVRMVEHLSHSACTPAVDFGYDHRGMMWVDHGCRGRFANDSSD